MNPRLLILIVVAAGMAIYFAAVRGGAKPNDNELKSLESASTPFQGTLDTLKLAGSEPAEKPDVAVQVEVDRSKGKNRLFFTISEAHGFYVEQFRVRFWYVKAGVTGPEDSPVNVTQFFDRYLPAKGTLRVCMELVSAELVKVNGDMGDTSNWKAEIFWHGRARAKNPDPMPPRTDIATSCD
jgi:hypothetical protein